MGDRAAVVSLLAYELQAGGVGYTPDPSGALSGYLGMACVQQAMKAETDLIQSKNGLKGTVTPPAIPPATKGQEISRWQAYIFRPAKGTHPGYSSAAQYRYYREHTGLDNVDARDKSYQAYLGDDHCAD